MVRLSPAIVDEHSSDEGNNVKNNEDGDDPGVASFSTAARLEERSLVWLIRLLQFS